MIRDTESRIEVAKQEFNGIGEHRKAFLKHVAKAQLHARAIVACMDDGRTPLVEILDEGPYFPAGVVVALDADRDAVNLSADRVEAVVESLTRIQNQVQEKP